MKKVFGPALAVAAVVAMVLARPDTDRAEPDVGRLVPASHGEDALFNLITSGPSIGRIEFEVDPPDAAVEMQVSADPTFASSEWEPVAEHGVLEISDSGYQMAFARFRNGNGDAVGRTLVDHAFVDPAASAALTGHDVERTPVHLGLVAPDLLEITYETGRLALDRRDVVQASMPAGLLASSEVFDVAVDGVDVSVDRVSLVSQPIGYDGSDYLFRHSYYLRLGQPLGNDTSITIEFHWPGLAPVELAFDELQTPSRAVHVNQVGYRPDDPSPSAYYSFWTGSDQLRSAVRDAPDFVIVDGTGRPVDEGVGITRPVRLRFDGARVWELPLGSLAEGSYQVCVRDVGCSETFDVSGVATWRRVTATVARALYHQRSGIELGPPYTAIVRPRPYHPDDGLVVRASEQSLLEDANGPYRGVQFEELVFRATSIELSEAWGGHFDAGDWDRRIQHLFVARVLVDLVDLYPDTYDNMWLQIPESGDAVPDLLDEALWTVSLFTRMQLEDGAVRGGIEAAGHPRSGLSSWTDDNEVFAYAPDAWSAYIYAAVAADAAYVLDRYDSDRAGALSTSALAAMNWAEDHLVDDAETELQRGVAAASLFRLTGESRWNEVFLQITPLGRGPALDVGCDRDVVCDQAWVYARIEDDRVDARVASNAVDTILGAATRAVEAADARAFRWTTEQDRRPLVQGTSPSTPRSIAVGRAYVITDDPIFLEAIVDSASFSLGANPSGTSYVTGLGERSVRNPLIADVNEGGLPVWPGTPVYGIRDLAVGDVQWFADILDDAGLKPAAAEWPVLLQWFDTGRFPGMAEFTIQQNHGPALFAFGILAGRPSAVDD